jgi:23S rRNA (adenine1618-N6)-methyltransferase
MREPSAPAAAKPGLHPRNPHRHGYDFPQLVAAHPPLARFVTRIAYGHETIDFADAEAVKELNRALLAAVYGVTGWDIPDGALCPPVPGRADYVHHLADLLAADGDAPQGDGVRVLDIGVGASCIYPILGRCSYGWRFVGTDVDEGALANAQRIVDANPRLAGGIELRRQRDPFAILHGVLKADETFAAIICNPPFHASHADAQAGTRRKWRNLGRDEDAALNFGGRGRELVYPGGEVAFVRSMIAESAQHATRCGMFTTLVSRSEHLPDLKSALRSVRAEKVATVDMAQGQKKSRILAWSFGR